MFQRVALLTSAMLASALLVVSPSVASTNPPFVVAADTTAAPQPAQIDPAKKAWFDRAVTNILEGRDNDPTNTTPRSQ